MHWPGKKAIYIKLNTEKHGNKLKVFKADTFFLLLFYAICKIAFTNAFMKGILSNIVIKDYCPYTVYIITKCT